MKEDIRQKEVLKRGTPILTKNATKYFVNKGINELDKKFTTNESLGITLIDNDIKDFMKVIKSLENREILLKGTTKKVINQKGEFFASLTRVGLPLMKNVLPPLAKDVLISLEVTAAALATDAAIQKKVFRLGTTALII